MYWAGPKLFQGHHVSSSPIPLVLGKIVLRPLLVVLIHQLVPGHLCRVQRILKLQRSVLLCRAQHKRLQIMHAAQYYFGSGITLEFAISIPLAGLVIVNQVIINTAPALMHSVTCAVR